MILYILLTGSLALSGVLISALTLLALSAYGTAHQIRQAKNHSLSPSRFWRVAVLNSALSVAMVYGFAYLFGPRLFQAGSVSVLRCIVEGVAILMTFDFFYYLVHRYPFHEWKLLRRVHAVHHIVRNPSAVDSLYMHPLENVIGLGLLWVCAFLVGLVAGPVSVYSFGWVFLVYSVLNVVVHAGIDMKGPGAALFTSLATRHNKHHVSMNGKNYASVTPIWDLVFRTEEP